MPSTYSNNPFNSRSIFETGNGKAGLYRLNSLEKEGLGGVSSLPYSIRILLEMVLRHSDGSQESLQNIANLARWKSTSAGSSCEFPYQPARVILQDFTGVPCIVDLAALRSAMHRLGGDPARINPMIPVDLVIDHSIQVDDFGSPSAFSSNTRIEFERNRERYEFLRWGQKAFDRLRVVPPATGIVHQVNLEYLACVVQTQSLNGSTLAFPDTLVGTDSHTTMINGLGVVGWGVGGIEAEAVMLGQPLAMILPKVIGFKLTGKLPEGATATDLVLTVTQILRQKGVVDQFVEYFGPGVSTLSLADRATLANMAPEYGATMGFFPVDQETLNYLRGTGRNEALVTLVERYTKEQGLFRTDHSSDPDYTEVLHLDMSTVTPSLAGPRRPQDRLSLGEVKKSFHVLLEKEKETASRPLPSVSSGAVVIAAITSCTNTSNPSVMLTAGLLAKKAVEAGLSVPPHVKTSLAPGSRVVPQYLKATNLQPYLEALGFHLVGYGCTTCIGNSGPLSEPIAQAIKQNNLVVAAVLSGNRNFEGRIHPLVKANYLASPPLVVAYALAGTVDIDLSTEPLGQGSKGKPVYLKEIWPTPAEIREAVQTGLGPVLFQSEYKNVFEGNELWNQIRSFQGMIYPWEASSTYIQEPPYFTHLSLDIPSLQDIRGAQVLAFLGDSVTTDHISPAGDIPVDGPAGAYLQEHGVVPRDFNSFGSRRGNHEVMIRGTFGNIRLKNKLVPGVEGGYTLHLPSLDKMSIYAAAQRYQEKNIPLLVLAGKEYGTGSSRDWAAKGPCLLGVKAVIAESFERIHRSNLVGMGVLPLQFKRGQNAQTLNLTGFETYDVEGIQDTLHPNQELVVRSRAEDGKETLFSATARLHSPMEIQSYRHGGILQAFLRRQLSPGA